MKRKNVVEINLSQGQRSALWASLELLYCLSGSDVPRFDSRIVDALCDTFDSLDDEPESVEFGFTAAQHRICALALKYALLYLSDNSVSIPSKIPELTGSALKDFSPEILELRVLFSV